MFTDKIIQNIHITFFEEYNGKGLCTYEETESYQVAKMFLVHREKMLEGLLGE